MPNYVLNQTKPTLELKYKGKASYLFTFLKRKKKKIALKNVLTFLQFKYKENQTGKHNIVRLFIVIGTMAPPFEDISKRPNINRHSISYLYMS